MSYTKGPWASGDGMRAAIGVREDHGPKQIADVYGPNDGELEQGAELPTKSEWEANTHLIAAAPELYEALKELSRQCRDCGYHLSADGQAERAIAKAEGKS